MAASQTIRTLKLSLLADLTDFGPNLKKAQGDFDKFQSAISKAAVPAAAALAGIGAAAFDAIQAASDLQQTFGAVEQIFGQRAARSLATFAEEAATSLGQSQQEALGAIQTFGTLGRTAGLEGDELAEFATTLTTLASDLAAFGNTTPQQAIEALGSALRGEFNPIERFGVVLNAAAVESIALKNGLADTASEITAQDQVYARFLGIMEGTAIQSGQAAREIDSIASQSNIAKANLANFKAEVGDKLLELFIELVPLLQDFVTFLTSLDADTIIRIGKALGILAGGITAVNAGLRAFAAVQAAATAFVSFARFFGVAGAATVAGGTAILGGVITAAEAGVESQGRLTPRPFTPPLTGVPLTPRPDEASFRLDPNLYGRQPRASTRILNINVNGFVGNERELARAIARAQTEARRQGVPVPTP